ncbi:PTH2 family peptidyl-tRNA hydrolase [Pyrrhoderma noxium]|uniref:peptidyl-tRNA hydrolase n=1 Tax=Pyrrhoderma noxium TaxID=2282107 RepID=A0A286UQN0_9AGAM|nr:PTH2 family peptidyl-tRNA hydrolase [Pyrrhoderma noxium]
MRPSLPLLLGSAMSSQAVTYAALAAVSLTVGYWAGVSWSLPTSRGPSPKDNAEKSGDQSDSEGSEDSFSEELGSVKASLFEETKLVLVVRTDLKMSSGKIAAQCAHASLACYKALRTSNPVLLRHWERTGQTKVALRVDNEEEMETLEAMARSLNLCARSIHDAGRTQVAAGSRTVLGIGPGPTRLVNQVTGMLKLL